VTPDLIQGTGMAAPHVGWAAPLVGLVAEINSFVEPRAREGGLRLTAMET
jgi:hypothetical protein